MSLTKGLLGALFKEIRLRRDRLGLVAFRHGESRVLLPFTANPYRAIRTLEQVPIGGKTPLAQGLWLGLLSLRQEKFKNPEAAGVMVVVSDGKPNQSFLGGDPLEEALLVTKKVGQSGIPFIFIDTDENPLAFGYGPDLARAARGIYRTRSSMIRKKPV
jgi:magnesium chelatase subunit D